MRPKEAATYTRHAHTQRHMCVYMHAISCWELKMSSSSKGSCMDKRGRQVGPGLNLGIIKFHPGWLEGKLLWCFFKSLAGRLEKKKRERKEQKQPQQRRICLLLDWHQDKNVKNAACMQLGGKSFMKRWRGEESEVKNTTPLLALYSAGQEGALRHVVFLHCLPARAVKWWQFHNQIWNYCLAPKRTPIYFYFFFQLSKHKGIWSCCEIGLHNSIIWFKIDEIV